MVEEGDGGGGALARARSRVGVHPDVAQAVVLAGCIAERVAQDSDERHVFVGARAGVAPDLCAARLLIVFGDAGQLSEDCEQFCAARDGRAFEAEAGLHWRGRLCVGDGGLRACVEARTGQRQEEESQDG